MRGKIGSQKHFYREAYNMYRKHHNLSLYFSASHHSHLSIFFIQSVVLNDYLAQIICKHIKLQDAFLTKCKTRGKITLSYKYVFKSFQIKHKKVHFKIKFINKYGKVYILKVIYL